MSGDTNEAAIVVAAWLAASAQHEALDDLAAVEVLSPGNEHLPNALAVALGLQIGAGRIHRDHRQAETN